MRPSFRIGKRSLYPWLFLGLAIAVNAVIFVFIPAKSLELFIPATGTVAGFVHFLYSQNMQETRLFAELFRQFNERYDTLNGGLSEITLREAQLLLTAADKQLLFKYFNLCGEEYLYYKAGYVDRDVWGAWCHGILFFAKHEEIRRLWNQEITGDSYYGFTLSEVERFVAKIDGRRHVGNRF